MRVTFKSLASLPLYYLATYGAVSILDDLGLTSEKAIIEKIFLSIFIALGILITGHLFSFRKQFSQSE